LKSFKLSSEDIRYIALFENITGAITKDCITDNDENKITFIVKKGNMGLAIGRKGSNIKRVKQTLGKKIEVLEHSDDPAEFLKNMFSPYRVKKVELKDGVAYVEVDERDKTAAVGKKGKNIQKIKALAKRHHDIKDVIVV
jgi:N utilization substance protein A